MEILETFEFLKERIRESQKTFHDYCEKKDICASCGGTCEDELMAAALGEEYRKCLHCFSGKYTEYKQRMKDMFT